MSENEILNQLIAGEDEELRKRGDAEILGRGDIPIERLFLDGKLNIYGTLDRSANHEDLRVAIVELEREMELRQRTGHTKEENEIHREERLVEIQTAHMEKNAASREYFQREADKIRSDYLKAKAARATQESLELHRFELRVESMSKEERDKLARDFITGETQLNEDQADALNVFLSRDGVKEILGKPFRQHIEDSGIRRPWEAENSVIFDAVRLYSTEFGLTRFVHPEDGELEEVEIAKMYRGK